MTYLESLPQQARLLDVFRAYPDAARPLLDYHQVLLRGPSPLSVAQRELIAAYVSALTAAATATAYTARPPPPSGSLKTHCRRCSTMSTARRSTSA